MTHISVLVGEEEQHKIDESVALYETVFYKSNFNRKNIENLTETPKIVKSLLQNETIPLKQIQDHVIGLLDSVLYLNDDMPFYSFGIIKLLQNTAIYLSPLAGDSRHIISPFSVNGVQYLGLIDGIFIPQSDRIIDHIDYLFGIEVWYRGFFSRILPKH